MENKEKEQQPGIPELPKTSPEIKEEEIAVMEQSVEAGSEDEKEKLIEEATQEVEVLKKDLNITESTSVSEAEKKVEAAVKKEGFLTKLGRVKLIKPILVALTLGLFTPAAFAKKDGSPEGKDIPQPVEMGERSDYNSLDIEERQVEVDKTPVVGEGTEKEKENIDLLNQYVIENKGELPLAVQEEIKKATAAFAGLLEKQQKTEGVALSSTDFEIAVYQPLQKALGIGKISFSVEDLAKQSKILLKMAKVQGGFTPDIQGRIDGLIAKNIVDNFCNEEAKQQFAEKQKLARQEAAPGASESAYDKISKEILGNRSLQYPPKSYAEFYPQTVRQTLPLTLARHLNISLEEAEKVLTNDEIVNKFVNIAKASQEAATGAGDKGYDAAKADEVVKAELPGFLAEVERQAGLDQDTVVGR